jgi:hypothetical protein
MTISFFADCEEAEPVIEARLTGFGKVAKYFRRVKLLIIFAL